MWGWRRVTVPPHSEPEPEPEPAPPSGPLAVTVPPDQIQRGSELTTPMLVPKKMPNRSKRELELIRKVMGQAKDKHSKVFIERIPRNVVIAFVEKLEKTHQHIDMREYLLTNCDFIKYDSDANLMVERMLGDQEGKHRFYGYYKEVIRRSVQERISWLNLKKKPNGNLPDPQYSECNDMSEEEMLFEPSCPVSELVFRTRRKDIVMDMNPEVELEKIKTSFPYFYDLEFVTRPRRPREYISVKTNTVRVVDVPRDTSEQVVRELLSGCGDIECVKMIRDIEFPDDPQHAVVTFKAIEGRDNALAKEDLKIDNKPVRMISRNLRKAVYSSQPVDVRVGSEPAKEKAEGDVDRMLHVLNRYWFCRQRYWKSNPLTVVSAVDDTTQK